MDEIEIDASETTEVRYRVDALRQDPLLEEALLAMAKQGVTDLTCIAVTGTDGEQTFASHGHHGDDSLLCALKIGEG